MEAAKFLASKLDNVGVAPKKPLLKFSIDKKKMTVEILNVNFLVNQFFRLLKTFFGFALGSVKDNGSPSLPFSLSLFFFSSLFSGSSLASLLLLL